MPVFSVLILPLVLVVMVLRLNSSSHRKNTLGVFLNGTNFLLNVCSDYDQRSILLGKEC